MPIMENDLVRITDRYNSTFSGIVTEVRHNGNGERNGILLVQITEQGNSWHRVGTSIDVGAILCEVIG